MIVVDGGGVGGGPGGLMNIYADAERNYGESVATSPAGPTGAEIRFVLILFSNDAKPARGPRPPAEFRPEPDPKNKSPAYALA